MTNHTYLDSGVHNAEDVWGGCLGRMFGEDIRGGRQRGQLGQAVLSGVELGRFVTFAR